jgi:hypothetical protein
MKKLSHWLASGVSALMAFASSGGSATSTTPERGIGASARSEAASGVDSIAVSESAKRQLSTMAKGTVLAVTAAKGFKDGFHESFQEGARKKPGVKAPLAPPPSRRK